LKAFITGTGSALPAMLVKNDYFLQHNFYTPLGEKNEKPSHEIIAKLEAITGITERRYVPFDQDSVPLMTTTALNTIADAGISVNDLSGIIVAHNAGNVLVGEHAFHTVPNMAALLKNAIGCTNYECFAYDILFGCPGWVQALIQAEQAIARGEANHILVLGIEVASRMLDPHDLDSMILADGCGACILSRNEKPNSNAGILAYSTFSHAQDDLNSILLAKSYQADQKGNCFFHMNGKEVYKYATTWVPQVIKKTLDKANLELEDIDMFLFHQANAKMLQAIANNLADLYSVSNPDFTQKIPTTISFLGNTSVASIPTMMDLILHQQLGEYQFKKGDKVVFASVGAGMHCNALLYQF
jgi:3-oxoacyl-[acyl-carrier-protein] synthase-3